MTDFERLLSDKEIDFRTNVRLSSMSTFKIGGAADLIILPDTPEKLVFAIDALRSRAIPYEVIGNASNILFADEGYRGALIFTSKLSDISIDGTRVVCGCGAMLPTLSRKAAEMGLSGFEFACGIPGTVGGGVFMNAGAHGGQMSDVLKKSFAYDADKREYLELSVEENSFSYRHSVYSQRPELICLGAELELTVGDVAELKERIRELMEKRRAAQPIDRPSAGSFFKRPEGHFAAKLIDDCGLKGCRVGGACISEKHAGFIVNDGGATCADVLALSEYVSDKVYDATGIRLEREVRVVRAEKR